jgi:hypothetical protein
VKWFGARNVFMDVDDILPGTRFPEVIHKALGNTDLILVVIGRNWLTLKSEGGVRRLDQAGDFVRAEVAAAMERKVPVLPILVQGASMPTKSELPEAIQALAEYEALELSDSRWSFDIGRLKRVIRQLLPSKTVLKCQAAAAYVKKRPFVRFLLPLIVCSAVLALWQSGILRTYLEKEDSPPQPSRFPGVNTNIGSQTASQSVTATSLDLHTNQILFSRESLSNSSNTNKIQTVKLVSENERTLILEVAFNYPGASGVGNIMVFAEAVDDLGGVRASGRTGSIGVGADVQKLLVKPFGESPRVTSRLRVGFWQSTGANSLQELDGSETFSFHKTWK